MFFNRFVLGLVIIFLQTSCSKLEPLYMEEDAEIRNIIRSIYVLPISGRYGVYLKNELNETFGNNLASKNEEHFTLQADVLTSSSSVESFNSDGTASRMGVSVSIQYALFDERGCSIWAGGKGTTATYNARSGGYNFGNIASQRAAIKRNIEYNVKQIYPHIYRAIKKDPVELEFFAPLIGTEDYQGC